jgi:hypothetical protein
MMAQAPDYGDDLALLDGQPTNLDTRQPATSEIPFPGPEIFHNYLPEVYVAKDRALGMFQLTKGRHILTFVCTGKDARSAEYNFGIQEVDLERVPQTPAATVEEARLAKTDTRLERSRSVCPRRRRGRVGRHRSEEPLSSAGVNRTAQDRSRPELRFRQRDLCAWEYWSGRETGD